MTKAHTDRGKATERLAVQALRSLGFPHAERVVRTGYTTTDRESPDAGDIDGTPGVCWQVKALRPATRAEALVPAWLADTEAQRIASGADVGVLVVRRDHFLAPRWWAYLDAAVLAWLVEVHRVEALHTAPAGWPGIAVDELQRLGIPARLELRDACTILRRAGYGSVLEPAEASA